MPKLFMRSLGWFGCARLPITLLKTYSWREATIFLAAQGRLVDFARHYGRYAHPPATPHITQGLKQFKTR